MALHRLGSVTIGVPDVAATAAYYDDFGLTRTDGGGFATAEGGEQLKLVHTGGSAQSFAAATPRVRRSGQAGKTPSPGAGPSTPDRCALAGRRKQRD